MTISSTTNTVSYTGNGSTTEFAVNYVFFGTGTSAEIQVVEVVIATGAETVKSNGSDFTVSGGNGATGTVTAAVAPANTVKWVINRTTTQTQETDYVENDPFPAESHEEALDRLTAVDQEQQRALDRTAQLPDGYTGSFDPTLPVDITGSTVLAFNAGATAFEIGPTTSAISGAAAEAAAAAASATASANSATSAAASAATASAYAGTQTVDRFNGTGSQTAFTLSATPSTENNTSVYISGVYQQKDTYAVSGTTLTFSTAPPSGTGNIEVMHMSLTPTGVDPVIGTVTTGAAGSSASVTATGPTLDFTIPRGDTGATGATGTAATITVGTTTTGNAGTSASVTNSGSSSAATFDFTIPKGDTGATGSTGATGAAATIAAGTATGLAAGASPTVTNSGSSSAATFNFGIPAGATGATGATGAAATIAAGTATGLAAGAAPTVTNSGSSSAATFDFGIPAGATGATGPAGSAATIAVGTVTTGAAGSSATVTNVGSSSAATFDFSIPQGADGTGSGDVTGPGSSTDNAIARFDATTGKLLQNSTVTVSDAGAIAAGSLTLTTDLAIADGGTGASTASAARTALNVDVAGTDNSTNVTLAGSLDYLTISGQTITRNAIDLATDTTGTLAIASGGTGATSASAARSALGVDAAGTDNSTNVTLAGSLDYLTISGQEITRGAIVLTTDVSGTLPIANGGTNATSAGAALTALGAAASGANSDITSLTGLTTDLTVAQGGTGAGTFAANGILYGNGTGALGATAVGTSGQVLTSNGAGSAPTFQAAAGGGATDIDGLSDALTHSSGATVGLGTGALAADNGGANNNTALGYNALNDVVSGAANTAVGHSAAEAFTALGGTFIGADAGKNGTGYNFATAVGYSALSGPVTGGYNVALGAYALGGASTTSAQANVCAGMYSGFKITTGDHNTFIGSHIGNGSLCTTGSNNTTLGNTANPSSATVSNEITLGNASIATLRCQVTSITALSDRRDKKDIVPLELGLDFINSLNPVKFTWDMRDGGKVGQQEAGFIAQELDEAQIAAGAEDYLDIVLKENLDKLEAAPGKLIPVLVKAIQDLSAEVATLKEQINGS